jgi:FG-GAP-like repeat
LSSYNRFIFLLVFAYSSQNSFLNYLSNGKDFLKIAMINKKTSVFFILLLLFLLPSSSVYAQQGESVASLDRLVSQIDSMFPPVEGYVISVDGDTLTLDLKQGQAIKKGDKLDLIRFGKEIIHPVTKKKVGRAETDLGRIEILDVRKDFSLAKPTNPGAEVRVGDGVRSPFQKLSFIIAPPKLETKKRIDVDRLRLNLEDRLNRHPRFQVPSFELGVWLLENGLTRKSMMTPENLEKLAGKVQADYILIPTILSIQKKMVLNYQLFSALDGKLEKQSKILSDQLPLAPKVSRKILRPEREQDVQSSFAPRKENLLQFVDKQEFPFVVVDFDIGDINGDGNKEFIIIDRYRVMFYKYVNNKFKRIAQIKTKKGLNYFLGVDVGDINGNGRDEIFITNDMGSGKLQSFVLEFTPGSKGPKPIWKDVNFYFRIIHPFDSKPTLLTQSPGFQDPFHGPIRTMSYSENRYQEGAELKLPSIYGMEFIIYGMTQTDLNDNGLQDTILLDKDYHLRVYSSGGRLIIKSNDYYGHDPRLIDVGVKEDVSGTRQGEPVRFRGRLQLIEADNEKFLLLPKNHMFGGGALVKTTIVENSSIVVLSVSREGFEKVFETKKQRGYLAAYQVMSLPDEDKQQVHVAIVDKEGLFGKETSFIYTYDWSDR